MWKTILGKKKYKNDLNVSVCVCVMLRSPLLVTEIFNTVFINLNKTSRQTETISLELITTHNATYGSHNLSITMLILPHPK